MFEASEDVNKGRLRISNIFSRPVLSNDVHVRHETRVVPVPIACAQHAAVRLHA